MSAGLFSVFAVMATLLMIACGIALLPALLLISLFVVAFSLIAGVVGFVLRLIGWILLLVLALPLTLAAFGLALAVGVAILHAALPLLLVIGIVWLIVHHHRGAQVAPHA